MNAYAAMPGRKPSQNSGSRAVPRPLRNAQAAASTSAEARDAYLKDAEQLLLDSGNIIPLYSRQQPYQIREGVAGAVNDGLGAWYFGSVRRVTQ